MTDKLWGVVKEYIMSNNTWLETQQFILRFFYVCKDDNETTKFFHQHKALQFKTKYRNQQNCFKMVCFKNGKERSLPNWYEQIYKDKTENNEVRKDPIK